VARAPAGPGGRRTGWAGTHSFSITRACDNPEAAASFLMALTSLQAQALEARNGALVARTDSLALVRSEFKKQGNQFMENVLDTFASAMTEDAFTPPLVPEWSAISDAMWPALQDAIVGKASVDSALKTAEERVAGVMQHAGRMR
jgi:multiple sugar transport system substrate-binding protein